MLRGDRTQMVLAALAVAFCCLAGAFGLDLWGKPQPLRPIPPVDPEFLDTTTWRQSYADLVRADEDVSYFDCYLCHDEEKKSVLKWDEQNRVVLPEEHEDIVMGHGTHGRNNNCFNCHNDENLLLLQMRDGQKLEMADSTVLCGSCHGPTHRDWTSGSHGRTSGYWDRSKGKFTKLDCVNCHDPHSPQFPNRPPAPGPNYLRMTGHEKDTPPDGETGTPPDEETGTPPDEETGTPPDGETDTPPDGETDTPPDEETGTPPDEETDTPPDEETDTPPDEETGTPPDEETDTPPDGETDTPPDEETDAQPDKEDAT